jgi:hypothetical protein
VNPNLSNTHVEVLVSLRGHAHELAVQVVHVLLHRVRLSLCAHKQTTDEAE